MTFIRENYPPNWTSEIVPRIRQRDGYRCTRCGVADKSVGYRLKTGEFVQVQVDEKRRIVPGQEIPKKARLITIHLETAHLDHGLTDHSDDNLASMCQRCHLNYDRQASDKQRQHSRRYGATAVRKNADQFRLDL